jgi:YVTN family beta-propeller protein
LLQELASRNHRDDRRRASDGAGYVSDRFVDTVTNKIYVANYEGSSVTVIDGATNSTTILSAGTEPDSIALNPVTNERSGNLETQLFRPL